jgi:hypothetical protein
MYVFLEKELCDLSPNFHIRVSVCHLYIPRIGPHIFLNRIGRCCSIICHRYQQYQWYRWQTLPPMSLILVVHLQFRIYPQIFKKFEITLTLFSGAWGKTIHEKKT